MISTGRVEKIVYRVVNFKPNGGELLLIQRDGGYRLPRVAVEAGVRIPEAISQGMRDGWRVEVLCLFTLNDGDGCSISPCRYVVTERYRSYDEGSQSALWARVSNLSPELFPDAEEFASIERCRASLETPSGPFARLGWLNELREQADAMLRRYELRLGNLRQINASPSFSLMRFKTEGSAVWLKAVGQENRREFHLSGLLDRILPGYVPAVLAIMPEWNAWITKEVDGVLSTAPHHSDLGKRQRSP